MQLFKRLFNFYIHGNIHVAFAVYSLVLLTGKYFNIDVIDTSIFVGLSTFVSYNWIRFIKCKNSDLRDEIFIWFEKNKGFLFLLNIISIAYLLAMFRLFQLKTLLLLFPFCVLTILYVLPQKQPHARNFSLRGFKGAKIFTISVTWAGLVVLFPLTYAGIEIGLNEFLFFIQQFIFVLVLTLPFDMRDLDFDSEKMNTIPQVLGIHNTKLLGSILLLIGICIPLFVFDGVYLLSIICIGMIQLFVLLMSTSHQTKYFASFWVEAIPVFWLIIINCFEII